ncbi:hypothetical protein IH992_29830, partial [Candidatus Poribacteria bacterium]|nr:hypothetical protein [Candidatus Poribacteria bacterium]
MSTLTPLTSSSNPDATYTWTTVGTTEAETVNVELQVTVTTTEGISITGTNSTTVTLDAGTPTADAGGPYQGGIAGGNFSPIQLQGNLPGVVTDLDVGEIVDWDWAAHLNVDGTLKGAAVDEGNAVMLTDAVGSANGQVDYTNLPLGETFTVEGEFWSGDGTTNNGADAFFVYLWNTATPRGEAGAGGYAIAYDEFNGNGQIQLNYSGSEITNVAELNIDNSEWRAFKVEFNRGVFNIYLDDILKLT